MSASLEFLAADGATIITTDNLGNVPTPGTSTLAKFFVKNSGDQSAQNTTVTLLQIGTNDGFTYAQLAPDVSGSPGSFSNAPLSLGNIAIGASVAFWSKAVLISGLTADGNPRRYNIQAEAQTV